MGYFLSPFGLDCAESRGNFMPTLDIQEALKRLQFRLGREVCYRPKVLRGAELAYRVDGRLYREREIVEWAAWSATISKKAGTTASPAGRIACATSGRQLPVTHE